MHTKQLCMSDWFRWGGWEQGRRANSCDACSSINYWFRNDCRLTTSSSTHTHTLYHHFHCIRMEETIINRGNGKCKIVSVIPGFSAYIAGVRVHYALNLVPDRSDHKCTALHHCTHPLNAKRIRAHRTEKLAHVLKYTHTHTHPYTITIRHHPLQPIRPPFGVEAPRWLPKTQCLSLIQFQINLLWIWESGNMTRRRAQCVPAQHRNLMCAVWPQRRQLRLRRRQSRRQRELHYRQFGNYLFFR